MLKPILTAMALCAVLGGCSAIRNSAANPFNWFGGSQEAPAPVDNSQATVNPLLPERVGVFARAKARRESIKLTSPIDQITDLRIERVPGGAIIRATGLDSLQGTFDAGLLPSNDDELPEDGVLVYTFERQVPEGNRPAGPVQTREVTVARIITDQTLRGVSSIRVVAATNARVARR
ncbi:MAG: hypothetical protein ABJL99_10370 [Aliishimia sp.]